ncbi:MAG TPA: substrate-binding domain-containing protein [Chthoniobacteraceae bacterium]|nr:substrate-binding domain-containing protein [Chthoniobacteraceae bacterium]
MPKPPAPSPQSEPPVSSLDHTASPVEDQVELYYTHEILSGKLSPGSRLPSNQNLARQWSTSCRTIQRAMASLTALGLIERAASRGTFVRSREQQAMVGVLMGASMVDDASGYYRMIWSALQTELRSDYRSVCVYDSLANRYDSPHRDTQISYLQNDLKYRTFVGFIEIATLGVPPEIRPSGYPVAVYEPKGDDNDLLYDFDDIGRQIGKNFHAQGVRRIWIFRSSPDPSSRDREVQGIIAMAKKLKMPPPKVFDIPAEHESYQIEKATHDCLLRELSHRHSDDWPEGLILTTDVAARGAILALLKQGVDIPQRMKLAVIMAENSQVYYSVPVQEYCLPIQKLASTLAEILNHRIAGKPPMKTPVVLKGWLK